MHTATRTPNLCPEVPARKPLGEYKLKSGYAFHLVEGSLWAYSKNEDWAIVVTEDDERSTAVGALRIDGAACIVFLCRDAEYRAQTFASAGCVEVEQ